MLLILAFAGGIVLSIVLLIWLHARNPTNLYLDTAKEWQTLIGALLGFIFLSASLVFSEQVRSEFDSEQNAKRQFAYTKILSNELNLYRNDLAMRRNIIERDGKEYEQKDCVDGAMAIQRLPIATYSLENSFPDLIPNFSDDFNFIATSAFEARHRYKNSLIEFDVSRCLSNPALFQDLLIKYHSDLIAEADGMQLSLIATLKPE